MRLIFDRGPASVKFAMFRRIKKTISRSKGKREGTFSISLMNRQAAVNFNQDHHREEKKNTYTRFFYLQVLSLVYFLFLIKYLKFITAKINIDKKICQ